MTTPNEKQDSQERNDESLTDLKPTEPTSQEPESVKGGLINFDGFKGESLEDKHKDWVSIL
jgi:hypothetical protein